MRVYLLNMKRRNLYLLAFCLIVFKLNAQTETDSLPEQNYGFDLNKLYVGGSLNLGYGGNGNTSGFAIGILPEVGYSIKSWLDLGLAFNFNYYSQTEDLVNGIPGYKATVWGVGPYLRVHPFEQFFIQAQPEVDMYHVRYNQTGYPSWSGNTTSTSYLVGIGYGRRIVGESSFFTSIMIDLGNDKNTPYKDAYGNVIPIIRSGFTVYLGRSKKK